MKPTLAPLRLSLTVEPEWANAAALGTAVGALVKAATGHAEAATNAGMVACELAENAIKYGAWANATGFEFRLTIEDARSSVEVISPYDPSSHSLDRLERILHKLREGSARDAYLSRVAEVAEKSGEVGQLGLLRIAHELGARITVDLKNGALHVRAQWLLAAEIAVHAQH